MTIEEKFFKLKPIDECTPLFDLELLYQIKPRGGESRMEFKNAGYGLTLNTAIRKIAHYCVQQKHGDAAIKLKEYFLDFKTAIDDITRFIREAGK